MVELLTVALAVGLGACDLTGDWTAGKAPAHPDSATVLYSQMPTGASLPDPGSRTSGTVEAYREAKGGQKKSGQVSSPYGCYLASRPYSEKVRFRSVYLYFPEAMVEAAGEKTERLVFRLDAVRQGRTDTTGVRYAHCVIPTAEGAQAVARRQIIRAEEGQALRKVILSGEGGSRAKTCKIEATACTCVGPDREGNVACGCEEFSKTCGGSDSGGYSGGGAGSGGSGGGTAGPYPDGGSGGGGEDNGGGTEKECTAIDPKPGSGCEPVEPQPPEDPCRTSNPPDWCEIGCEVKTAELETMFFEESNAEDLETFRNLVHKFGGEFGVDSEEKLKHFVGQMAFESGYEITSAEEAHFSEKEMLNEPEVSRTEKKRDGDEVFNLERVMESEKLQFSVYYDDTDRLGNGEPSTYDGWKYRGRGPTQLTGRFNYKEFDEYYSDFAREQGWNAPDLLQNPEKLSSSTRIATIAALRFWDQHVSGEVDEFTVENVTEAINGGESGLEKRKNQTEKAQNQISCNN